LLSYIGPTRKRYKENFAAKSEIAVPGAESFHVGARPQASSTVVNPVIGLKTA
jgi:hypothetical protein